MAKTKDYTGLRAGRLVFIEPFDKRPSRGWRWLARCDCGNTVTVEPCRAESGKTRSCGCLKMEGLLARRITHGQSRGGRNGKTYARWLSMRKRCSAQQGRHREDWANYAGRGIVVCERWANYLSFLADMGECPDGMTLERIDVEGNYEPGNCRWASQMEQSLNKTNTRMTTWDGQQLPLLDACRKAGISYQRAYSFVVRRGGSFEEAVARLRS